MRRPVGVALAVFGLAAGVALVATRTLEPESVPREPVRSLEPGPVPAESLAARPAPRPNIPQLADDTAGEHFVSIRADTVVAFVDGAPLTGLDVNPALADGDTLPIRRDVYGSMVERAVERSLASQEAVRLGIADRADVRRVLSFVEEGLAGDDEMSDPERDAYIQYLRQQRLEMFYLRSAGAHRDVVLDDWLDRLVATNPERYAAISDSAGGNSFSRDAVRAAVGRDFTERIAEETAKRRFDALSALRRAVRIVVVDLGS